MGFVKSYFMLILGLEIVLEDEELDLETARLDIEEDKTNPFFKFIC